MRLDYFGGAGGGDVAVLLLVVKATLILMGAVATALLMKRATAGARHLVWVGTLAALLTIPAISTIFPLKVPILPPVATAASSVPDAPPQAVAASRTLELRDAEKSKSSWNVDAVAPGVSTDPDAGRMSRRDGFGRVETLAIVWGVVMLAILAVLGHAAYTVRQIVRRGSPLQRQDWLDTLYEIADRLDLPDAPRLVKSDDVRMPFACGFRTPTIVLPADCEGWSMERRHAVLLHELAHVQRRDLLWHTISRVTCAVYWFHPLVWTAARRLRAESERACDDVALALGARAADYAEHLLDIVSSVKGERTPVTALAMARRKEFEGRMLAILDPDISRARPGRLQSLGLVATIAMVVVLIGAAAPVPRAESMEAPGAALEASLAGDADEHGASVDRLALPSGDDLAGSDAMDEDADTDVDEHAIGALATAQARADARPDAKGKLGKETESASDDERAILLARVLGSDTSASVRRIAAWGLAEHAEHEVAVTALASALRRDADASVREMAAWALAESRGGSLEESALAQALHSDRDARVRATAAWALGNIDAREAVPVLLAALRDSDADVRIRALWALGNADVRSAPPELIEQLKAPSREIRTLAAWALYEIEDPAAVPALSAALKSERDPELQMAYIRALASIGEESVDAIRELLDSSDPRVKRIAVQSLAGGDAAGPWPWPWPEPRPYP